MAGDAPREIAFVPDAFDVERPRGASRFASKLRKCIDRHSIAAARQRAEERFALALTHDHACRARQDLGGGEFVGAFSVGCLRQKVEVSADIAGLDRPLEPL